MLDKEFQFYLDHQNELAEKYDGLFIVIVENRVVGSYKTNEQAYLKSQETYRLGTFLIQKCGKGEENYTSNYQSRVILTEYV